MRNRLLVASLLVLAATASACAKASLGAGSGGTVTVDRSDSGKTVTLHVGQRLALDLGPAGRWVVGQYPRTLLTLSGGDRRTTFEFTAKARGTGTITAATLRSCGPGPRPQMAGVQCPVAGSGTENPTDLVPGLIFHLNVHVA